MMNHVICALGKPGAGKSFLQKTLLSTGLYHALGSITTRLPRATDVVTKSVSEDFFLQAVDNNEIIYHQLQHTLDGKIFHYGFIKPDNNKVSYVCDPRPMAIDSLRRYFEKEVITHKLITVFLDVSREIRIQRIMMDEGYDGVCKRILNRPELDLEYEGITADIVIKGDESIDLIVQKISNALYKVL